MKNFDIKKHNLSHIATDYTRPIGQGHFSLLKGPHHSGKTHFTGQTIKNFCKNN